MLETMQSTSVAIVLAQAGAQGNPLQFLFPMVIFGILMYLMLIRPQNKKLKEHKELMARLKAGDRIVTNSGIYATITGVTERTLKIRIADKVEITISRAAVARVLAEDEKE